MKIQLVSGDSLGRQRINVFLQGEHHLADPSAASGGVSFPATPSLRRFAITTTVVALGTVSAVPDMKGSQPLQNVTLVLPTESSSMPTETTAAKFRKLKDEIVASGIPLLSDEDLREEIRDRKGAREP